MDNICQKCKNGISSIDEVACSNCGATYHSWCWSRISNCVECNGYNKDFKGAVRDGTENLLDENAIDKTNIEVTAKKTYRELPVSVKNDSGMFSNIGEKIKTFATVVTIIGIIAGTITCISMLIQEMILEGLLIGAVIALASWISSFTLYGFGELISTSRDILRNINKILKEIKKNN